MEEKQNPNISIITPSFNQAGYIESNIRSIQSQKGDFLVEHIVIDGGSDDGTLEILNKYKATVKWVSEKDNGQSDALNKGIRIARGEIVGWLNSDDVYHTGALAYVTEYFKNHPESMWLYGQCNIINENGREVRKFITWYKRIMSGNYNYKRLLIENYISQPAVFFRKKVFDEVGLINTSYQFAMDYDLWIRLGKMYNPGVTNNYLAGFRIHRSSKSKNYFQKQFSEQYDIASKVIKSPARKFLHRLNNIKIISLYKLFSLFE